MNKISAVIITYNEELNIRRCIESVLEIADEIVIVDSYSTDKTKEISMTYPVVFIEHAFEGYIEQKNFATSCAKNDYVLSLDADEMIDNQLKKSILKLLSSGFDKDGYFMNRMTNYCGHWIKHGSWYPDRKLRLWNQHKGRWGGVNPHDRYEMKPNCAVSYLKGDILHYSYHTISGHIQQFDKFTEILAKQMFEKGKKASLAKVFLSPFVAFLKGFFVKMAFLDGYYGIVVCLINTFATFFKFLKLRELHKNHATNN